MQGGEKTQESVLGLVRARRFLRGRFGSVHIHCDEPISLAEAMGDRRGAFHHPSDPAVEDEKLFGSAQARVQTRRAQAQRLTVSWTSSLEQKGQVRPSRRCFR